MGSDALGVVLTCFADDLNMEGGGKNPGELLN